MFDALTNGLNELKARMPLQVKNTEPSNSSEKSPSFKEE
jgi:hypothetical protein